MLMRIAGGVVAIYLFFSGIGLSAAADANVTFDVAGATLTGIDGGMMRAERAKVP